MTQAIEALPDDPNQLKAMLLAERARNCKCRLKIPQKRRVKIPQSGGRGDQPMS